MEDFQIPKKLEKRLSTDKTLANNLKAKLCDFAEFLSGTELKFFIEYTDHSIDHINKVLGNIVELLEDDSLKKLNSLDASIIIAATVFHDIGMKATVELFQNMLKGTYDYGKPQMPKEKNIYNDSTWAEEWNDYVKKSQFWNRSKKLNVIGDADYSINPDELNRKLFKKPKELDDNDKCFIGEFIRIHHGRLAYEIAIRGYWGYDEHSISLKDALDEDLLQLAGMVARSHSIGLRENYKYLMKISDETNYKSPCKIDIILHMVLIRLSDYLHIDKRRTKETVLYLRKSYSPFSLREHEKHLAIRNVVFEDNIECISVDVKTPVKDAELFVSIEQLIHDIQSEFDTCWAVLEEQYSYKYKLKYRRITSNLSQDGVRNSQAYVPQQFRFKFNNRLTGLLIAPLYGDDPSYGVRELVQNAVDACRTRMTVDKKFAARNYNAHVSVTINSKTKRFTIVDKGIGMTIEEIEKYFLTIGSSYNDSTDWKKAQDTENATKDINSLYRTGRFGIGILAAFLLGKRITVKTRSIKGIKQGYQFTLSLDQEFIQINKVDVTDFGTTIEIKCNKETIESLDNYKRDDWCNWYIDTKPIVKYFYDGEELIPESTNVKKHFNKLEYNSNVFGDILWEHKNYPFFYDETLLNHQHYRPDLYCNGFLISKFSEKKFFSMTHQLEHYLPLDIPNLIVSDIQNILPLNLKRDDIDKSVTYPFEKELATAMFKDVLCQLLAIDIQHFRFTHHFFFNSTGYTINCGRFISSSNHLYVEKCLQGKTLIHIIEESPKRINAALLTNELSIYPDAFISFYNLENLKLTMNRLDIEELIDFVINNRRKDSRKPWDIALNQTLIKQYDDYRDIITKLNRLKKVSQCENYGEYYLVRFSDSNNTRIAKELIDHADKKPLAICIYDNTNHGDIKSVLDDFIDEYASGELMIPFDEEERRKKFIKLYEECADDIDKYRKLYSNYKFMI